MTSGAMQFLTQIATLKYLNMTSKNVYVFYIGVKSPRLEKYLCQLSQLFQFNYSGSIYSLPNYPGLKYSNFFSSDFFLYLFNPRKYVKKKIKQIYTEIESLNCDVLVIPFRHKVRGDVFLETYINPEDLIITADGVIGDYQLRDFSGWRWRGVSNRLSKYPLKLPVYSPSFLSLETENFAKTIELPDFLVKSIYSFAVENYDINKKFIEFLRKN